MIVEVGYRYNPAGTPCASPECNEPTPLDGHLYCTDKCRSRAQYLRAKERGYWDRRYQRIKKEYRRSLLRHSMSLWRYMKLPRMFR